MRLAATVEMYAGGSGSGCHGENCGRPRSRGEAFEELASKQRGTPESKMLRIQHHMLGPGVYSFVVEHAGDLSHRMSEHWEDFKGQYDNVKDKVAKVLRVLESPYGFEREMEQNLRNNYKYAVEGKKTKLSYEDAVADLKRTSVAYADAHKALPVHNSAQALARNVAVSLGQQNFVKARQQLRTLKGILDKGREHWVYRSGVHLQGEGAAPTENSSLTGRRYRVMDTKYGQVISEHDDYTTAKRAALARPFSKVVSYPRLEDTPSVRDRVRRRLVKTNPDTD